MTAAETAHSLHQITSLIDSLSRFNTVRLSITAKDPEGWERQPLLAVKKPDRNLLIRFYEKREFIDEEEDDWDYRFLTKELNYWVKNSQETDENIQVDVSIDYREPILVPAGNMSWVFINGEVQLGRL